MIPEDTRTGFAEEHALFRASVRQFVAARYTPHLDRWEADGLVDGFALCVPDCHAGLTGV